MTNSQFQALLDEDTESGGTGYSEIVREAWRARRSEAELLEALEGLVNVIDRLGTQGGKRMERARAAIAKAKGEK